MKPKLLNLQIIWVQCLLLLPAGRNGPAFLVTNIDYGRPVTGPQLPIPEDAPEPDKKKNKK